MRHFTPMPLLFLAFVSLLIPPTTLYAHSGDIHLGDQGDGYGFTTFTTALSTVRRNDVLTRVQDARFGWLREEISWRSLEPTKGDFSPSAPRSFDY